MDRQRILVERRWRGSGILARISLGADQLRLFPTLQTRFLLRLPRLLRILLRIHSAQSPPVSTLAAKPAQKPTSTNLPETFASKLSINNDQPPSDRKHRPAEEPWPPNDELTPPYPTYYLDADYETLDAPASPNTKPTMVVDNDESAMDGSGGGKGGSKEDRDTFESTLDKTFQHFADRLAQNPLQVLRYEHGGAPLLYSKTDAVGKMLGPAGHQNERMRKSSSGIPRCGTCGAERVFELQLTPHAISELEAEEVGMDGMEWGTVILGVCSKDCVPSWIGEGETGYVEEWAGVQWEEVGMKR